MKVQYTKLNASGPQSPHPFVNVLHVILKVLKTFVPFVVAFILFYVFLSAFTKPNSNYQVTDQDLCIPECDFSDSFYENEPTLEISETCLEQCGNFTQSIANFSNYMLPANFTSSTCSFQATARGKGQKLLSYSFYGNLSNGRGYFEMCHPRLNIPLSSEDAKRLQGIERNVREIRRLYPEWLMRVYHDIRDVDDQRKLCILQCEYSDVMDTCFVGDLPGYGNIMGSQENVWRFLALSDPLVDVMLSRDLDSLVSQREVAAVSEWLQSNMSLHIMRDHFKGHGSLILAGMWGARVSNNRDLWRQTGEKILRELKVADEFGMDQKMLRKYVWPLTQLPGFAMQHDSYNCLKSKYKGALMRPFPTQRDVTANYNFVGSRNHVDEAPMVRVCPEKCRKNKAWKYC